MEVNKPQREKFSYSIWNLLGVIVEDCLSVLLNLLKNNPSNQSYFRESSFIRRLVDCFALNSIGDKNWLKQKETNVNLFLQVKIKNTDIQIMNLVYVGNSNTCFTNEFKSKYRCMST